MMGGIKNLSDNQYQEIIELSKSLKLKDVAKKYNIYPSLVSYILKKNNIKVHKSRLPYTPTRAKGKLKNRIPDIGEKFGYWTIIDNTPIELKKGSWFVKCRCICDRESYVRIFILFGGKSRGCPCTAGATISSKTKYVGNISQTFFGRILKSARVRNLEFSITREYMWDIFVKQNQKCALSGVDIYIPKVLSRVKGMSNITASLDRIDSSLGYIENNIQWVHKDVNLMKQHLKESYFINFCKLISKHIEYKKELHEN